MLQGIQTVNVVYVTIENRPGSLARAASALGKANINIDAVSVETNGGQGFARFLTARPSEAVKSLKAAGIQAFESETLVVPIPNRPGELARVASELGAAGINIESVASTPDGKLLVRTNDARASERILQKIL